MALTHQDRIDINDLINRHGHLIDSGDLDQLDEVFTPDVAYDVNDFGFGTLNGVAAIRQAALALGEANPVGHHVTNIVITPVDDDQARVRSKGIGVNADATTGSAGYDDLVTRETGGWRIARRTVTARRAPLGRSKAGVREVLERWRRASIRQDVDELGGVYAAEAVCEFPFTPPGVPSRLEGRDAIVSWTAALWRTGTFSYERYRTLAVHDTADAATIVVEQEVLGKSTATGAFALANIVVVTARGGRVVHLRDYVDVAAAAAVAGLDA